MTNKSTELIKKRLRNTPYKGRIVLQDNDPNSKYSDLDGHPTILYPESEEDLLEATMLPKTLGKKRFLRSGLSSSGNGRRSAKDGIVVDLSYFSSIEITPPANSNDRIGFTVGAAVTTSQLAKELIRVNAFLPISDNPVRSVVSHFLSDQLSSGYGYFERSMGCLHDYVKELRVITPEGDAVSISKTDQDYDSVLNGNFKGVIETISFSAIPAAHEAVYLGRVSCVYAYENFAAVLKLLKQLDIPDTVDVSVHAHHIAYDLSVISVTIAGKPENSRSIDKITAKILHKWNELSKEQPEQQPETTQLKNATTPAEVTEFILEGGISDNPYLDRNLTCRHYNKVISINENPSSSSSVALSP